MQIELTREEEKTIASAQRRYTSWRFFRFVWLLLFLAMFFYSFTLFQATDEQLTEIGRVGVFALFAGGFFGMAAVVVSWGQAHTKLLLKIVGKRMEESGNHHRTPN